MFYLYFPTVCSLPLVSCSPPSLFPSFCPLPHPLPTVPCLVAVVHSLPPCLTPGSPTQPQVPPLTLELQPLLQRVRDGWRLIRELGVPESKIEEVQEQFGSDENGAVSACIQWWLQHATSVSWREIVYSLDWNGETEVADTIRQYLEPPTGTVPHMVSRCRNDSCAGELSTLKCKPSAQLHSMLQQPA